jgi:hypothetical protein
MFFIVFLVIFSITISLEVISSDSDLDVISHNFNEQETTDSHNNSDYDDQNPNSEYILHGLIKSKDFKTIAKNFNGNDISSAIEEGYEKVVYDATSKVFNSLQPKDKEFRRLIIDDYREKVNVINLIFFDKYLSKIVETNNSKFEGFITKSIEPISILQMVAFVTQNLIKEKKCSIINRELSKIRQSQISIILNDHNEFEDYITRVVDILFDVNKKNEDGRCVYPLLADIYGNYLRNKMKFRPGKEFIAITQNQHKFFDKNLADQEAGDFLLTISYDKYYENIVKDKKISRSKYNRILLENNKINWTLFLYLGCKKAKDTHSDTRLLLLTPLLQLMETDARITDYKPKKYCSRKHAR